MRPIQGLAPQVAALVMALAALGFAGRARRLRLRVHREMILGPTVGNIRGGDPLSGLLAAGPGSSWAIVVGVAMCAWAGWLLGGVPTATAAGMGAAFAFRALRRRRERPQREAVDRRVQEFADGIASAVRGGQSIAQAVEFAAAEAKPPVEDAAQEFLSIRAVGAPFQPALERFAERIGTDESRLLALVLGIHHRVGGDVAAALEEVSGTIRHRLGLRRELRALTAQGRVSGLVLGVLPVGFFLVMALTSRGQMQPVLRSMPGAVMVTTGLLLDGLALLWIHRLLRIEA
jgi:tight adherence protein B